MLTGTAFMPLDRTATFWRKLALAAAIVALADWLLLGVYPGASVGVFGLAVIMVALVALPPVGRNPVSRIALASATAFALLQIERATPLGFLLFCICVGVAALAPRAAAGEDAWRWVQRLVMAGLKAVIGPFRDAAVLLKARARGRTLRLTTLAVGAIVPVAGGIVFFSLFMAANPVLTRAIDSFELPGLDVGRLLFWGAVGGAAWAVLRPRGLRRTLAAPAWAQAKGAPWVGPASVTASLVVFNAVFALQNGLDVAFLWSGAALPKGMTYADYAHRGAYPLIATAILAGLFVLVFLRPGSATARGRWPRILVTVWVVQNQVLVASTAFRTWHYVEVYALTRVRIAALIWMGLVAVGLALICWRLLRNKSASWLINANALAAGVVLATCSVIDLGAVAARWNVAHAAEVGGGGEKLDLCYLGFLEGDAIVPLAELERRPMLDPTFRDQVTRVREMHSAEVVGRMEDWRSWRWRDARRLARVKALVGRDLPPLTEEVRSRRCDGLRPQLTPPAQPGT
jgi:hypothetical protein